MTSTNTALSLFSHLMMRINEISISEAEKTGEFPQLAITLSADMLDDILQAPNRHEVIDKISQLQKLGNTVIVSDALESAFLVGIVQ